MIANDPHKQWAQAITKEEHDELMKGRTRPLTDRHPGRRRDHDFQQPDGFTLLDKYLNDHLRTTENDE